MDRPPDPVFLGFPGGSTGKESACNAEDLGSIPGLERSPGEGKGYLQYSPLRKAMNGGAWWATIHGTAESDITEQPSTHTQGMGTTETSIDR